LLKKDKKEALIQLAQYQADAIIHVFPQRQIALLARQVGIKYRIGTTNRLFHWGAVNKLVHLSRSKSALHEAQLNCKLLEPLGIKDVPELKDLYPYTGFNKIPVLPGHLEKWIDPNRINVILHPKSNAHAREWNLGNYRTLINLLPPDKYKVFISGNEQEGALLADWIKTLPASVKDITGKFSLAEFIAFIARADYLVSCSTGPLHIAAALGRGAIGLFPNIKPMDPGRWQPIGPRALALSTNQECSDCRKNPPVCHCINEINPRQVADRIQGL
jgi:heptosyltransferase-3